MKTLFKLIGSDLKSNHVTFPKAFFVTEFRAAMSFRIYSFIYINVSKGLGFLWYEHSKKKYCMDIAPTAKIGAGMVIVHIGAIVVGRHVEIGKNIKIQSGVTLGMKDENSGMPKVGNNCYIGTGSKIMGSVTLGDNCTVGANAVVINDAPEGSTIVGIPGRILKKINLV